MTALRPTPPPPRRRVAGGLALAAALALGGCAQETATTASPPASTASTPGATTAPTAAATRTATPTAGPGKDSPGVPTGKGARGRFSTLRGTVTQGEEGCFLLQTPTGVYALIGPQRGMLYAGMRAEVQGAPDDTAMTTCQQGTPFLVTAVRPG